jgi:hypothetical protein
MLLEEVPVNFALERQQKLAYIADLELLLEFVVMPSISEF